MKEEQAARFDQVLNYCRTLEAQPLDVTPQDVEEEEDEEEEEQDELDALFQELEQEKRQREQEQKQQEEEERKRLEDLKTWKFEPIWNREYRIHITPAQLMHICKGNKVSISMNNFNTRVFNSLIRGGIRTFEQLLEKKYHELNDIYGMGERSVETLTAATRLIKREMKRYEQWVEVQQELKAQEQG